jgi:hypothetical protein
VSDFLDDRIVYRNLVPVDSRLPPLAQIRPLVGLPAGLVPRKSELAYAQVIAHLLREARALDRPGLSIERLIYVGDTRLNDGSAFANICQAGGWPGLAFIGSERGDTPQVEVVEQQMRTMPTDPARVRRTDPGNPDVCPVWQFHEVYSDPDVKDWVQQGCRSAAIGCIECKQPVIDAVLAELKPMQERARSYAQQPDVVRNIINEGCERAREVARETMDEVRHAMFLDY